MPETDIVETTVRDVVPNRFRGFDVRVGVGPYPPDAPHRTDRRAMYAELSPASERARKAMAYLGKRRVLGMIPLTPEGAGRIAADPAGPLAETAATDALRAAIRLVHPI